jgi:monovalent cation:H+ antiporter-2, CPA2 family
LNTFGGFLQDLAVALCSAAVASVLFQRLRLPAVLGYLLAGMVIGPYVPIQLFADVENVQGLSELGVTLLVFSIGLEFSLRKLIRLGPSAIFVTSIEVALVFWLGFTVAQAFGWSTREAAFAGAIVSIASTMVVAKLLAEKPVDARLREFVFGIVVVEDVVSMVLLAMLTALVGGAGVGPGDFAVTALRLAGFLAALIVGGLLVVPRLLRWVMATGSRETILLAAVGVCFAFSLLARNAGYSIALGAFVAGALVAEAGHARILEPLVRPLRDVFSAIFFVSVGMMIDPAVVAEHWGLALALVAACAIGKLLGLTLGGALTGIGVAPGAQTALWMIPLGEFGFLVAQIGRGYGEHGNELHAIAAAVCVATVAMAPLTTRASGRIGRRIERSLSPRMAVYETLYGTWIEALGSRKGESGRRKPLRIGGWVLLDAFLVVAVVIGTSLWIGPLTAALAEGLASSAAVARAIVVAVAALACVPFCIGLLRGARRLGVLLADQAIPGAPTGELDLAAAPRRALVQALQLAVLVVVGVPVIAVTQPFLPSLSGVLAVLLLGGILVVGLRRRGADLEGHFRAGAQVVLESLVRQGRDARANDLALANQLLPGMGQLTPVRIDDASPATGRTLDALDLHGRTGASVVCVARGTSGWVAASAERTIEPGDLVALTGTEDEIARARSLLGARDPS